MVKTELQQIMAKRARALLSLEVNPPKGVDLEPILSRLQGKLDGVDFLNVTDSALARMRLAPLPFASILKQRFGIEPLVNIACRDRNLIAIQSDLLAGWAMGVRSIVALTGDAVTVGDSPERKAVFEVNSIGLLNAIRTLNSGYDLAGNELKGRPEFITGVVVNPNAKNINIEIGRLQKKKDAGAAYAVSQPVFDEITSQEFFKQAAALDLPIFMSLMPLKTTKAAQAVTKIPGIKLSEKIKSIMGTDPDKDLSAFSIEHCLTLAKLNRPYVAGFHVVTGANAALALDLVRNLASDIASSTAI